MVAENHKGMEAEDLSSRGKSTSSARLDRRGWRMETKDQPSTVAAKGAASAASLVVPFFWFDNIT